VAISNPTKTTDFDGFLTPEQSGPIFERAARSSVVQQLARQVPLGPTGTDIPVVTGRLQASWVAEGGQKPVDDAALSLKNISPKKIAVIAVVSEETVRANPGNYMSLLRNQMGEAFALAFDAAALHGTSTPFSTYIDQTTKAVELGTSAGNAGGVFQDLNAGLGLLVAGGKRLTGFAFDDRMEPTLNGAVDSTGRPLFIESPLTDNAPAARGGRVLGRPAFMGEGVGVPTPGSTSTTYPLGYGGDWTQAAWGVVGGIRYSVSTETSVTIGGTLTSLWEHNLVAIRAEAEYGWLVNDTAAFVKYTETTASS
jgi:HK97 family phage major capsid protein